MIETERRPAPPAARERVASLTLIVLGVSLLFWASAFAGIGAGLRAYAPGHLALLRFLVASAALAVYAVAARLRLPRWADMPAILGLGFLGFSFYHMALTFGQVTVPAGVASLLIASSPVFTALIAVLLLRERLTVWGWLGILLSFAGIALIALGKDGHLHLDPGALLIVAAAISVSFYNVFSKHLLRRYSALEFTAYAIWGGTLLMLFALPGLAHAVRTAPLEATLAVVYIGVFPGALSYVGWSYALARAPASLVSSFLYLSPPLAMLIAWVWLGELPAPLALLGGALALAGVVVVNTRGR